MHPIRKVLIIPYCDKQIFVVQHTETKDWTFISGTCESGEGNLTCMTRELFEETLNCVKLTHLPTNTETLRIQTSQKKIKVFFIPIRKHSKTYKQFMECKRMFKDGQTCENCKLRLISYRKFLRLHIWNFIRDAIISNKSFQTKLEKLGLS
jgi:hypothetical protein